MPSTGTQDLLVDNTVSCENQSTEAVHLGQVGTTGIFRNVNVHPQVDYGRSSIGAGISNVILGGIYDRANYAWLVNNGDNIAIDLTIVLAHQSTAGISLNDPATHVTKSQQLNCVACGATYVDNRAYGVTTQSDVRQVAITSTTVASPVFDIQIPAYGSVTM